MKFSFAPDFEAREKGDLLIVPFWEGGEMAVLFDRTLIHAALDLGDFKGKMGEVLLLYVERGREPRICLLGLGDKKKVDGEMIRRAYAEAAKVAQGKRAKRVNVLTSPDSLLAAAEGILLSNYAFTELRGSSRENAPVLIEEICWIGALEKKKELERIQTIVENVYFARNLINGNADDVTPKMLADTALSLRPHLHVKVLDKKRLEEEKMGLILAVSRASSYDPFLVELSHQGNSHSKEQIVLIGKGITYDTGGLALKPVDNMMSMKCDMSGAATVMAAVKTAAQLQLKVNVTAVAPLVENGIGPKSYKLGDVYRSASGKTVEVTNTDAEGRLVLADAMTYVQKYLNPTCMIDIASLTGSVVIGLGEEIAGLFTSDPLLSCDLMSASQETGELLWPMPIHADYFESLKSDIADLANQGGREAGATKAALFLKEFAGSIPWAHVDFAGPCYWQKPRRYSPTKATGFGVRLLVEFLEKRQ